MAFSPALRLYRLASPLIVALAERKLKSRAAAGKEAVDRLSERRGIASRSRPEGLLVWFHAASVGESLSLINLIEDLSEELPDAHVLVTTGTRTSADIMDQRLPDNAVHQFVPIDTIPFVDLFLDHWKPDLAVWTESELWPALITRTAARDIPMLLLNARMSQKSSKNWNWLRGVAKTLLESFAEIHVQDQQSAKRFEYLGAPSDRLKITGSLKESGGALPHDEDERATIATALETRPLWLAASTHPGEEEQIVRAHRIAQRGAHRLLLVIAPRHPERGPEIVGRLRADGWRVGVRSDGDMPDAIIDIYVADTLGEMGLWYRLAPFCFLGGSLVEIGGHNPYEPAALGSAILHGPHVSNAAEIYERLDEAGGARTVRDADDLGRAALELIEPHKAAAMAHVAWEVSSSGAEAGVAARDAILAHLRERQG